ncbi:hypothetical protein [Myroides marinus]|uniref:Uncharacterized protein n=1 Tax=Myroides marinus TaxID=703342 RepID=A0A163X5T0_9FLAO|nr:hypothetical protein [Myroides marinus]KZE77350.1 hypothetical protein AV926_01060 [Myroides marinus]MDM1347036.1 hypothetical protein [Myroides marinus]MDM1362438.1 hypothetical protein [Myroides marinus]
MRVYFIYVLFILVFLSCKRREFQREFNFIVSEDLVIDTSHSISVGHRAIVSYDSIKLFESQDLVTKFKYSVTEDGIFLIKGRTSNLLYSFKDSTDIVRPGELTQFFYESVKLVDKREYQLKNEKRVIYHFVESGFDETLDSYYMYGEGFICFYKYADNSFIYLNSPKALEISSVFLNDSTFFAMLKMRNIDKQMGRQFE